MVASVLYNVSAEEEKNLASGIVSLLTGSTLLVFDVGISHHRRAADRVWTFWRRENLFLLWGIGS